MNVMIAPTLSVFFCGLFVFMFLYAYWCHIEIEDKRLKFVLAMLGGILFGMAARSAVEQDKHSSYNVHVEQQIQIEESP